MENKNNMNMVLAVIICLALVGLLIFISIRNKTNMVSTNNTADNSANVQPASGEVVKAGDMIALNYTGKLKDGTVFDSNVDPQFGHVTPLTFKVGAGQMIAGFDKGVVGMKVGEKKTISIPPEDAYGAAGRPGIPPNSTLIFDVELLEIKK